MSTKRHSRLPFLALVGLFGLLLAPLPGWPQFGCPAAAVVIGPPANGATNLCGIVAIGAACSTDAGGTWETARIEIRDSFNVLVESGFADKVGSYYFIYAWDTTAHSNGSYTLKVAPAALYRPPGSFPPVCYYSSAITTVWINNPSYTHAASQDDLERGDSETDPLTGNVSLNVPVASWDYKGASFGLTLSYDSEGLTDPQTPAPPNFAGLSERNPKWSHTYAQWIDLWRTETGAEYAVWHVQGGWIAFKKEGTSWVSPGKVIEAVGTPLQQETNLFYDAPDGNWGLPTRVQNETGAESSTDYHDERGWPLSMSSPQNLVVPPAHPDRAASVTVLAYNSDHLPSEFRDAEGHLVTAGYQGTGPGNANLKLTLGFQDGSNQQLILDPFGKLLEGKDERGIRALNTFNPLGDLKTVTRAAGTADQTLTTNYFDGRGDLSHFDPPNGSSGRVHFEYVRYLQDGTLEGTYEGQVTRIRYPDNTSEYFGYNDAAEPAWRRKADGTVITLDRDAQHRVWRVNFPASQGNPAFSVSRVFDEFGREKETTDNTGTTQNGYDVLDRQVSVTPPNPQKALSWAYTKDTTLKRWITTVNVAGVGDYTWRGDTKGRLSELVNPFGQAWWLEYDRDGKNTLVAHPNGVKEERAYTPRDWLASILFRQQNGQVFRYFDYLYTDAGGNYDPTGHKRREIDSLGQVRAFGYNDLYRVTWESHPEFGLIAYADDPNGNRLSRTTAAGTDYYGPDAQNKLLWVNRGTNARPTSGQANPYSLFGYDLNGRMTARERKHDDGVIRSHGFFWDGDDRLRTAKEGATTRFTALYNGEGLRVAKWDHWTGQHDYSWGPGGVLHDSNGNTTFSAGFAHRQNGADRFYHPDWLGSTRYLSDSTGNNFPNALRYDAYGQKTGQSGGWHPTDFLFAGGWGYQTEYGTDTEPGIGLQYLQQRYYDAATGRFPSVDPIGHVGGLNLYAYCQGDPVGRVDPWGLRGADVDGPARLDIGGGGRAAPTIDQRKAQRIVNRMTNLENDIKQRERELVEDPLKLPTRTPGDKQKGSESRQGHRWIIDKAKAEYAKREQELRKVIGEDNYQKWKNRVGNEPPWRTGAGRHGRHGGAARPPSGSPPSRAPVRPSSGRFRLGGGGGIGGGGAIGGGGGGDLMDLFSPW